MLFKDMKPRTATTLKVLAFLLVAIVCSLLVVTLVLDGQAQQLALIFLLSMGPVLIILAGFLWWMALRPARYQRLVERGIRGIAAVKNAKVAGRVNTMPVLRLELEVRVPGKAPYRAYDRVLAYPGTIERDATFECVVDPEKPSKVVILRDEAVLRDPNRTDRFTTTS